MQLQPPIVCLQLMALSGSLGLSLALSGSLWFSLALSGPLWLSLVLSDSPGLSLSLLAPSGSLCLSLAQIADDAMEQLLVVWWWPISDRCMGWTPGDRRTNKQTSPFKEVGH